MRNQITLTTSPELHRILQCFCTRALWQVSASSYSDPVPIAPSGKCAVVTDHGKLIATLSLKDRALRGAWDILNGVLKDPTQAETKLVIPKNHIAYYLRN